MSGLSSGDSAPMRETAGRKPTATPLSHLYSLVPVRYAGLLSLVLTALTAWGLYRMETFLLGQGQHRYIRPFGIGFLVPVVLMTVLAGRRFGLLTLVLSAMAAVYVLAQPFFSWQIQSRRDATEVVLLLLVGGLVISGVEAMRRNAELLADVTDRPAEAPLRERIERAAKRAGVDGVGQCLIYLRGLDYYVHLDVTVSGETPVHAARQVVGEAERAIYRLEPTIFQVRVRIR